MAPSRLIRSLGIFVFACCLLQHSSGQNLGKAVYEATCAVCHGKDGKGGGLPAALLDPKPRDFTGGKFKFRSTESGSIPTDKDLENTITNGLHGTSMPDWKPYLHGDSLKAVIEYVKAFSPKFKNEKPRVLSPGPSTPSSSASIASGKKVYQKLQCGKCHGDDGKGTGAIASDLKDEWGYDTKPTMLTEPWTFRGGATPKDLFLRIRTGIDGTPMPSYKGTASDAEMWNLANYVLSLARKPVWSMNEAELKSFYSELDRQAKTNPVQRGKYLVETMGCASCHSQYSDDGTLIPGAQLSGGYTFDLYPYGVYVTGNLTSDKETGLGAWTDDEIKRALTRGIRRDGSRLLPFPMPWTAVSQMKEDDVNALVTYLLTVPPVKHFIPEPKKPGLFAYLWGKFRVLILKEQIPALIYHMKSPEIK